MSKSLTDLVSELVLADELTAQLLRLAQMGYDIGPGPKRDVFVLLCNTDIRAATEYLKQNPDLIVPAYESASRRYSSPN